MHRNNTSFNQGTLIFKIFRGKLPIPLLHSTRLPLSRSDSAPATLQFPPATFFQFENPECFLKKSSNGFPKYSNDFLNASNGRRKFSNDLVNASNAREKIFNDFLNASNTQLKFSNGYSNVSNDFSIHLNGYQTDT